MKTPFEGGITASSLAAFAALTMLLPGIGTAAPTITIYTDVASYDPGDRIEVSLSAENYDTEITVDVYIGMIMPDGTVMTHGQSGFSIFMQPWIRDIYVPAPFAMDRTAFIWLCAPQGLEGDYLLAAGMANPSTTDFVSDLSFAAFRIESDPTSPRAFIDSISPSPAIVGVHLVQFRGHSERLGGSIVAHEWCSDLDGVLSNVEDFDKSASNLSLGKHTISYTVQDDDSRWAAPAMEFLVIEAPNAAPKGYIDSIWPNPAAQDEGSVTFLGHGTDSDGTIATFEWSSNLDGILSTAEDFEEYASALTAGSHIISYRVKDDGNLWSEAATAMLTVTPALGIPLAVIDSINPNPAVQSEDTLQFRGHGETDNGWIEAHEWCSDIDGILSIVEDFEVSASALALGTHTISYRVRDDNGSWSEPATEDLIIQAEEDAPQANIDAIWPNPATQGRDIVEFMGHGTVKDTSIESHEWSSSLDGLLSTSEDFSELASNLTSGRHTIYYRVKDSGGRWSNHATDTLVIESRTPLPSAHIDMILPNPASQQSDTVQFRGHGESQSGAIVSHEWYSSLDGMISFVEDFSVAASDLSVGTHTISLRVQDADGLWSAAVTESLIIEEWDSSLMAFIDSITPNPATQGEDTIDFTGHGVDAEGTIQGYEWSSSLNSTLSIEAEFSLAASSLTVGTHTVSFRAQNGEGEWSQAVTETLVINGTNTPPQAVIDSISPNPAAQGEDTVAFTGSGTDDDGTITGYEWSSDLDGLLSTETSFSLDASELTVGSHIISFKVQDNDGEWSAIATSSLEVQAGSGIPTAYLDAIWPNPAVQGDDTVNFRGHGLDSDGTIAAFEWSSDLDGALSTLEDFELAAASMTVGAHTISFRVQDNNGLWSNAKTTSLVIRAYPTAVIDAIYPTPATQGAHTVHFMGHCESQGSTIAAYEWSSDLDGALGSEASFSLEASDLLVGTHTISYRLQDADGLWSAAVSESLVIEEWDSSLMAFIDSITPNPATQGEDTVEFTGHGVDAEGTIQGYEWSSSLNGTLSIEAVFSLAASDLTVGTHTISFRAQNGEGEWSQADTETLVIGGTNTPPQAVIDSISPNPATQGEDAVAFTGSGTDEDGTIAAYEWSSDLDGLLSSEASFSKAASELTVGTHTISFKAQDDDGEWSEVVTSSLEVQAGNGIPTAYLDAIWPNPAVQGDDTVNFCGHGLDSDGTIAAFEWSSDLDGALSTLEDFELAAASMAVGTHVVSFRVQDNNGLWSNAKTTSLVIRAYPTAVIDVIYPSPAMQGADTVHFMGHGESQGSTIAAYEWSSDLDGALSSEAAFSLEASELSVGTHEISYRVQDADGLWSEVVTESVVIATG